MIYGNMVILAFISPRRRTEVTQRKNHRGLIGIRLYGRLIWGNLLRLFILEPTF